MAPPRINNRILERYVLEDERIVIATRHHWARILEPIATAVLSLILVAALTQAAGPKMATAANVLWFIWLAIALRSVWMLLEWRALWFVATDKRLLLVYGLVTHKVSMMPLRKVTDMSYNRSPLGRVLGYGQFLLESAGQEQAMSHIEYVTHPDATYRTLCDTLFSAESSKRGTKNPRSRDHEAVLEPGLQIRPDEDDLLPTPPPPADSTPWQPRWQPVAESSATTMELTSPNGIPVSTGPIDAPDQPGWEVSDETRSRFIPVESGRTRRSSPRPGDLPPSIPPRS